MNKKKAITNHTIFLFGNKPIKLVFGMQESNLLPLHLMVFLVKCKFKIRFSEQIKISDILLTSDLERSQ